MENEKLTEDKNKELLAKIEELESKISALEDRAEQFGSDVKSMRSSFEGIKELSGIAAPAQISSPEQKLPVDESPADYPVFSAPVPPAQQQMPAWQQRPQMPQRPQRPPRPKRAPKAPRQPGERQSFEQFIGKNAMGIGASILVFIAMVMFATLLMPYIGEELKCAAMYIFSFILIGLGEWVYRKNKSGYMILTACGMGALFISLFATKIYFKFIDSIPLYALLLLWMGCCAYLGKKRHLLFVIIGQIGLFIALSIAAIGLIIPADLYLSFGFLMATEAIFFALFWKSEYKYNLANTIGLLASLAVFVNGAAYKILSVRYSSDTLPLVIVLCCAVLMTLAVVRLIFISKEEKQITTSGIVALIGSGCVTGAAWALARSMVINGLMGISGMISPFRQMEWCYALTTIYLIAVLVALIKKQSTNGGKRSPIQYICFGMMMFSLLALPSLFVPYLVASVLLALVAYNYKVNQKDLYYVSQAVVAFSIIEIAFGDSLPACAIILALSLWQMLYSRKKNPDIRMMTYEYVSYITTIALTYILVDLVSHQIWTGSAFMRIFATVGMFIVIQLAARETDWTDSDNGRLGLFHFANLAAMLYALDGFQMDFQTIELIVYSLLVIGLFSLNLDQLLIIKDKFGAYISGKYTLLAAAILNALDAVNYAYSIVFLLISIASIVVGFKIKNKSMRLFGLVLSMLSIVKLIMFDVSYSNTLMRALSFLASGLICFGISLVYNRIDKQQKQKTEVAIESMHEDKITEDNIPE